MQIRVNQYWLSAAGSKADCAVRTPHLTSYLESERNVIHVRKLWSVVVDPGLIIARATQMLCGRSCSSQKKSCGASEHIVPSAGVSLCNCQSSLGGPSSPASSYPQTVLLHSTPNHPHSLSQPRVQLNLNVMVCALTSPPAKRTVTLPLLALPAYPAAAAAAPP